MSTAHRFIALLPSTRSRARRRASRARGSSRRARGLDRVDVHARDAEAVVDARRRLEHARQLAPRLCALARPHGQRAQRVAHAQRGAARLCLCGRRARDRRAHALALLHLAAESLVCALACLCTRCHAHAFHLAQRLVHACAIAAPVQCLGRARAHQLKLERRAGRVRARRDPDAHACVPLDAHARRVSHQARRGPVGDREAAHEERCLAHTALRKLVRLYARLHARRTAF